MNHDEAYDYLLENERFSEMPEALRGWILASSNATTDFADFFERGGFIDSSQKIKMPYYVPHDPPKIMVDEFTWKLAHQANSEHMQRAMFGTLVHEIGHDRYNTAITKFAGGSAADYVRYRADIEAQAIFNAYPIFKDLQNHPDFKASFPFESVGYLGGFELGQYYKDWSIGKMDSDDVVSLISSKVSDTPYGLSSPLADQNGDGVLTHQDLYLRDYNELIRRQPEMAAPPKSARTAEVDSIDELIAALRQGDNEVLRTMRKAYFESADGQYLSKEARTYSHSRELDANAYLQSRGLTIASDGHSIGSLTGRRDPRDWDHPDHALYSIIRRDLPAEFPDETAAQVMLEAKQQRILRPHDIDHIEVHNGHAHIAGKHFRTAHADLCQNPPPMQDTVLQSQKLDQQLAQERAQWLIQQQELARSGPSMSL